jgi:DNA-binding NarL/FixJ family response regulator
MINVFIIDDHPSVIEGIEFILSDEEDGVKFAGSAENVPEALKQLTSISVDVILLDLIIGSACPVKNITQLKNTFPKPAILVFSADDSSYSKYKMFKAGANGYLSKCSQNETIISTIKKVADGSVLLTGEMTEIVSQHNEFEKSVSFSEEELEIVHALAHGKSLKEIGVQLEKSVSMVEKNLTKLRHKTGASSNTDRVRIMIWRNLISSSN